VFYKSGFLRGALRNGVGVFRNTQFKRTASLFYVNSRTRTALDAVKSGFLILGDNVFMMGEKIFGDIDGIKSRGEVTRFKEV